MCMGLIIRLIISTLAVYFTAYLLPGVQIDDWITALMAAIFLGVVNMFVKPIIQLIALPITILTLGLFSIVVNGLLILLVAALIPGFAIDGFIWALAFGLVLWVVHGVLDALSGDK